jgi:hypothetical protein
MASGLLWRSSKLFAEVLNRQQHADHNSSYQSRSAYFFARESEVIMRNVSHRAPQP